MSVGVTGRGDAGRARKLGGARLLSVGGLAALTLAALSAGPAAAQTWTGTTSNDWTIGTNWGGGTVPAGGTVVINKNSPNPTILGVGGPAVGTTGQLIVGNLGGSTGSLTIQNGSTLTSTSVPANSFLIGSGPGVTGIVTVTGAGSRWTTSGASLNVGSGGNGTLNIQNGGTVVAGSVFLGDLSGTGTLNINGGSTLELNNLGRVAGGTAQVNFDGATLRARANNNFFTAGFLAGNLNIAAGGLTVDTQTFTVRAGSGFSGVGGLTKTGTGTLNLNSANTYTGDTVIQAGTLGLTGNGSIATSNRVVVEANGTLTIAAAIPAEVSIQSLAGSGSVALGTKTLRITDGKNDTFSGVISGAGWVKLSGGTQTFTGANTYSGGTSITGSATLAVSSDGALGDVTGAVTFDSGALRTMTSFATSRAMSFVSVGSLDVDAGTTLTVNGPMTGPGALTKLGEGTLLQNSVTGYLGGTAVAEGTLQAGAANVFGGAYSTLAGATLDLGGFNQTIASFNNAGAVRLGGAPGTTLTVTGNFVGSGGVVYLNTALGDDTSATDRLIVGSTSGASSLVVTNVGGAGAQTGRAGIKVVDVLGASNGTFALIGDYVFEGDQAVVGGAYAYRLYQGTEDVLDGDWYLRSEIIDAGPLYAPTVPLYENYANVLQGFNELGTLQQRVGGREWLNGAEPGDDGAIAPEAIWARMDASQAHFEPGVSTTGASYDVTTWRLQAGLDGVLNQSEAGSLVAGVNAQFGTVGSDISSIYGAGSINALGYGVGATLTWYGAGGLYVDGQAQATWYSADITSDALGTTLVEGNDAFGYGLSIEAGQKIGLDDNWSLTPQAQLSYSAVRFSDFTDQYGGTVSLDDGGDTLVGRLGLSADYAGEWQDAAGETKQTHLYGIANLYYDFLDGTTVDVSGTKFVSQNQGLWGGVGVGGSLSWADDQFSVFGEALVRGSVDDFGGNHALGAKVGFNAKW